MAAAAASLTDRRAASADPTPAEAAAKCGLLVLATVGGALTASAFAMAASAERSAATETSSLRDKAHRSSAASRKRRSALVSGGLMDVMIAWLVRLDSLVMWQPKPELADHPDRLRWNERYQHGYMPTFTAHPLAVQALEMRLPPGPVLEIACGPSGSALLAAASGRQVVALDVSDVALGMLGEEAARRGLTSMITLIHGDAGAWQPDQPRPGVLRPGVAGLDAQGLDAPRTGGGAPRQAVGLPSSDPWRPESASYALVLCTSFWDREVFAAALSAVADRGSIGWEALTTEARLARPTIPPQWCVGPGEPASLLPPDFSVVEQQDAPGGTGLQKRQLLAIRG